MRHNSLRKKDNVTKKLGLCKSDINVEHDESSVEDGFGSTPGLGSKRKYSANQDTMITVDLAQFAASSTPPSAKKKQKIERTAIRSQEVVFVSVKQILVLRKHPPFKQAAVQPAKQNRSRRYSLCSTVPYISSVYHSFYQLPAMRRLGNLPLLPKAIQAWRQPLKMDRMCNVARWQ
jgi:hypothetical protein